MRLPEIREVRSGVAAPPARLSQDPPSAAKLPGLPSATSTTTIGLMALCFSALYFLSDVIEVIEGGFSTGQLWVTLIAEGAIPVFVLGLAVVQRPRFARLGSVSAVAYAYSYLFFTGTVVYALVNNVKDYRTLSNDLGAVMIVHGAVMVFAGLGFGYAVIRARQLPAWSAAALMVGVVLVAATQSMPDAAQLIAAGIRDLGFAGMGASLVSVRRRL